MKRLRMLSTVALLASVLVLANASAARAANCPNVNYNVKIWFENLHVWNAGVEKYGDDAKPGSGVFSDILVTTPYKAVGKQLMTLRPGETLPAGWGPPATQTIRDATGPWANGYSAGDDSLTFQAKPCTKATINSSIMKVFRDDQGHINKTLNIPGDLGIDIFGGDVLMPEPGVVSKFTIEFFHDDPSKEWSENFVVMGLNGKIKTTTKSKLEITNIGIR